MNSAAELNPARIESAKESLKPHIRTTPLEFSQHFSSTFNSEIYLKLENWQKTGSFKIRGALNKMLTLSSQEKQKGVITASAGNHALGVAQAAQLLGVSTKIVVPEDASPAKVQTLGHYDLELIKGGADYDAAEELAWEIQRSEGTTFVHAFSDLDIIAGQGTIGLEILEQLPDARTIVVPVGGGGLISGVAAAAKSMNPDVRVIGVESVASAAMYTSVAAGRIVETPIDETIADGLAGRFVTDLTLELTQAFVDEIVLVSEDAIKEALVMILETEHMLVEASAAAALAAVIENKLPAKGKSVLILTGRNISLDLVRVLL